MGSGHLIAGLKACRPSLRSSSGSHETSKNFGGTADTHLHDVKTDVGSDGVRLSGQ